MELNTKVCGKCGARWMAGQLFWATGSSGKEEDLAGLVCNNLSKEDAPQCINPKKGDTTGQTWEFRRGYAEGLMAELDRATKDKKSDA